MKKRKVIFVGVCSNNVAIRAHRGRDSPALKAPFYNEEPRKLVPGRADRVHAQHTYVSRAEG